MAGFVNTFYGFVYASLFIIVFVTASSSLKPFRTHKRRRISTMFLKLSYLIYLSVYLVFIFLILFLSETRLQSEEIDEKWIKFYLGLFLVITLFPNMGIVFRRKFKKVRVNYNITLTAINFLATILIILLLSSKTWGVLL
jgi:uncharacterized membrane protein YhaH (DUF805 family)